MMNIAATDPKRRALGKGLDSLLPAGPMRPASLRPPSRKAEGRARFHSTRSIPIPSRRVRR
jgi:hypothetical protein